MKRSLKAKLILSYLAVALIVVLVVSFVIRLNSGQSLMSLVADQQTALLSQSVQRYYQTNGSLDGFMDYYNQNNPPNQNGQQPAGMGGADKQPPQNHDIRGVNGLVDTEYKAIFPMMGYTVGDVVSSDKLKKAISIEVDDETIAYIIPDTHKSFTLSSEEEMFLERTSMAIAIAALVGVLFAVVMGFLLARVTLKPIQRLTKASQELSSGNLGQEIEVTSQDELGQLTSMFNKMSTDLLLADQQRKRMTADITHDLSTPLQIISGYVEMLEDGSVTLTPQRIEIIKTEIEHLRRLVGDLTTLSQVEAGGLEIQKLPVNPSFLLENAYNTFQPIFTGRGIELVLDAPSSIPPIMVDEIRTLQVLKNLIENASRYTSSGGKIILSASYDEMVRIKVIDNGAGIDAEDLPYIFDRFYRADPTRETNSGKMGLGLAICKALVNAQGGTIKAESQGKGFGTTITISFAATQETITDNQENPSVI